MSTPILFWLVPFASLVALFFAWYFFRGMMRQSEGTERMQQIAAHVRAGAMAYLRQQYKVVAIVFLLLPSWLTASGCRTTGCRSPS